MYDKKIKILIELLNKGNIKCNDLTELNGMFVPREIFMNGEIYKDLKEKIPELKTLFSSSYLTSLQTTAEKTQRWPLLNLMRQVLRCCNYKLMPKRISDGYSIHGKKIYKRMFIIEKMRVII